MVESQGAKKIMGGLAAKLEFQVKYNQIKNTMASMLMQQSVKHRKAANDKGENKPGPALNEPSIFNIVQDEASAVKNIGKDLLERIKY